MHLNNNIIALMKKALGRTGQLGQGYNTCSDNIESLRIFESELSSAFVRTTDVFQHSCASFCGNLIEETFQQLNVDTELKLSVRTGLVKLDESWNFLSKYPINPRIVNATIIYKFQTKKETLDITNHSVKSLIHIPSGSESDATHIITGVEWGSILVVFMQLGCQNTQEEISIKTKLESKVQKLRHFLVSDASIDNFDIVDKRFFDQFDFKLYGDIIAKKDCAPKDLEECVKSIRDHFDFIDFNKGIPIEFTLLPMKDICPFLFPTLTSSKTSLLIPNEYIEKLEDALKTIYSEKAMIEDLRSEVEMFSNSLEEKQVLTFRKDYDLRSNEINELLDSLKNLIVTFRSGVKNKNDLEEFLSQFNQRIILSVNAQNMTKIFPIKTSIRTLHGAAENAIKVLGSSFDLSRHGLNNGIISHILCYTDELIESHPEDWKSNFEYFIELKKKSTTADLIFCMLNYNICKSWNYTTGLKIAKFKGSTLLCKDLLCFSKSDVIKFQYSDPSKNLSDVAVPLKVRIPCPRSCSKEKRIWKCSKCLEFVRYYGKQFYCECGMTTMNNSSFICTDPSHTTFPPSNNDELSELLNKMCAEFEINILVLGETGVGKSTFINAFANYLSYDSLQKAENANMVVLIPSKFSIVDENYETRDILVGGNDRNERFNVGKSCTKEPRCHSFPIADKVIRIIDTPGIGDVDGIETDKKNFENILYFISRYEKIHGILILLKPNNARTNVTFRFCINELLTHLHKDAARNIIFCFTNARGTFYKPGDTLPALKRHIEELENASGVKFVLNRETMYCFDNEAFRFLAAVKNGVKFEPKDKENFSASFQRSVDETSRLMKRILSLSPHNTKQTISINDARIYLMEMSRPLAAVSRSIETNIKLINDKEREIKEHQGSLEQLKKKLLIPSVTLAVFPLDYPRTVCTSEGCTSLSNINGVMKANYITHCHEHCYLQGVTVDCIGASELIHCKAMLKTGFCELCGCHWRKHMHTNYDTEEEVVEVIDEIVKADIEREKLSAKTVETFLDDLKQTISNLRKEKAVITKISAKFAYFLKSNSILPYNDAIGDYLKLMIREEEQKRGAGANNDTVIEGLKASLSEFEEQVISFMEALKQTQTVSVKLEDLQSLIDELYSLPINGSMLKGIINRVKQGREKALHYKENVYVPPSTPSYTSKSSSNGWTTISKTFHWMRRRMTWH